MIMLKEVSTSSDLAEWDAYLERAGTMLINSGLGLPLAPHECRFLCCAENGDVCGLIRFLFNGHVARLFALGADNDDYFKAALREIILKMYAEMNVVRIQVEVVSEHVRDIRLYRSIGFHEEGVLRDHIMADGTYCDLTILGMLREDIDAGDIQGK